MTRAVNPGTRRRRRRSPWSVRDYVSRDSAATMPVWRLHAARSRSSSRSWRTAAAAASIGSSAGSPTSSAASRSLTSCCRRSTRALRGRGQQSHPRSLPTARPAGRTFHDYRDAEARLRPDLFDRRFPRGHASRFALSLPRDRTRDGRPRYGSARRARARRGVWHGPRRHAHRRARMPVNRRGSVDGDDRRGPVRAATKHRRDGPEASPRSCHSRTRPSTG